MHRDLESLLAAVCDAPEDDDLRGVVADWLEENAKEDDLLAVAAVIRRELAPATSATGPAQEGELPLPPRAMRGWTKILWGVAGVHRLERGFPDGVVLSAADFIRVGGDLFRRVPARRVALTHAGRDAARLAGCPHLSPVLELNLREADMTDEAVGVLARSPYVAGLRVLDLLGNAIGNGGARELLGPNNLPEGLRLFLDVGRISYDLRGQLRHRFDLWEEA